MKSSVYLFTYLFEKERLIETFFKQILFGKV